MKIIKKIINFLKNFRKQKRNTNTRNDPIINIKEFLYFEDIDKYGYYKDIDKYGYYKKIIL